MKNINDKLLMKDFFTYRIGRTVNSGFASVCRLTIILPPLRSGENQGWQTERQAAKRNPTSRQIDPVQPAQMDRLIQNPL